MRRNVRVLNGQRNRQVVVGGVTPSAYDATSVSCKCKCGRMCGRRSTGRLSPSRRRVRSHGGWPCRSPSCSSVSRVRFCAVVRYLTSLLAAPILYLPFDLVRRQPVRYNVCHVSRRVRHAEPSGIFFSALLSTHQIKKMLVVKDFCFGRRLSRVSRLASRFHEVFSLRAIAPHVALAVVHDRK